MPEVSAAAHKHTATRTCVGCGKRDRQADLVRVQIGEDAQLRVVARAGRGRSAYLHTEEACRRNFSKSRLLSKSLRQSITDEQRARFLHELQTRPHDVPTSGLTKA